MRWQVRVIGVIGVVVLALLGYALVVSLGDLLHWLVATFKFDGLLNAGAALYALVVILLLGIAWRRCDRIERIAASVDDETVTQFRRQANAPFALLAANGGLFPAIVHHWHAVGMIVLMLFPTVAVAAYGVRLAVCSHRLGRRHHR